MLRGAKQVVVVVLLVASGSDDDNREYDGDGADATTTDDKSYVMNVSKSVSFPVQASNHTYMTIMTRRQRR